MQLVLLSALLFIKGVTAHVAAHGPGMYCLNGLLDNDINSSEVVHPLYKLNYDQYWMRGACKNHPPADGEFLNIPAGGTFTVELASNRGQTTLTNNGSDTSAWPDGLEHPDDMNLSPGCIISPNLHTQNESMAAGTAFAIAYTSDIFSVKPEDMAVFSVKAHTPWKRVTTYEVPANMPACPEGGCICSWGWIANGCGEPNMYQNPFRCKVTGATSTVPVGKSKPAVWCEDDPSKCIKGPKQLLVWHQNEGDNIVVDGFDLSGGQKSPGYNSKCGFFPGPQNDIFEGAPAQTSPPSPTTSTVPSSKEAPTPTPTPVPSPSYIPVDTIPPVNNATTSTGTSIRSRPSRCPRASKRSAIAQGVASHLKRRRLAQRRST